MPCSGVPLSSFMVVTGHPTLGIRSWNNLGQEIIFRLPEVQTEWPVVRSELLSTSASLPPPTPTCSTVPLPWFRPFALDVDFAVLLTCLGLTLQIVLCFLPQRYSVAQFLSLPHQALVTKTSAWDMCPDELSHQGESITWLMMVEVELGCGNSPSLYTVEYMMHCIASSKGLTHFHVMTCP